MTSHPHGSRSRQRRWALLTALGAVLFMLSVAGSFLFFLQPWATCPDSESPAGCPVTGVQVYAQAVTFFLVPASLAFLVAAGVRALGR